MNNSIREIIKSNLQKLSKDELVDALVDVYMACPPFSIISSMSRVQEIKSPIKEAINQRGKYAAHKCTICRNKTTIIYILENEKGI